MTSKEQLMRIELFIASLLLTWSATSLAGPGDMVSTSSLVVKEVQIQNSASSATYYFVTEGGWQAGNCSGVLWPYIGETAPGAKAIIAAALASKTTGTPLSFTGICGDTAGDTRYLQIRFTVF
jgi:hypothetical protein